MLTPSTRCITTAKGLTFIMHVIVCVAYVCVCVRVCVYVCVCRCTC